LMNGPLTCCSNAATVNPPRSSCGQPSASTAAEIEPPETPRPRLPREVCYRGVRAGPPAVGADDQAAAFCPHTLTRPRS
jgi:hypothetical protein